METDAPGADRRMVLAGAGAAALVGPSLLAARALAAPVPQRLSILSFAKDPKLVGALRRGVNEMRGRDPKEPGSWWWQGSVHHLVLADVPGFPAAKPMPGAADQARYWNQCPHGLSEEGADEFLGWHAAYLLHFEDILRAASGLDRLRLPYWDYTDPAQRKIPALFVQPKIRVNAKWEDDPQGQEQDNPLYEGLRSELLADGTGELDDGAVDISWFKGVKQFRGLTPLQGEWGYGFGGGHGQGKLGMLEVVPHGQVHSAIGGDFGLMGSTTSAAFDPIFWPHHANIDRLWRRWLAQPGRGWGAFGDKGELDAWMARAAWPFKRQDGTEALRPRGDYTLMSRTTVRYEGEPQVPPDPVLVKTSPPGGTAVLAISPQVRSFSTVAVVARAPEALVVRGATPSTVTLSAAALPESGSNKAVGSVLMNSTPTEPTRLVLDISRLQVEGRGRYGYEVYVNLPQGAPADRTSPQFVGVLQLFGVARSAAKAEGMAHMAHGMLEFQQSFDVTAAALATNAAQPQIAVTFKPFPLVRRPGPMPDAPASLTVSGVALRVIRGSSAPDM